MTLAAGLPAYVIDSSVAVKWVVVAGVPDQRKAFELLEAYQRGHCTLRAPDLLVFEVANALSAGRRFTPSEVKEALQYIRNLDLQLEGLRWATLAKAVEIASSCDAAVYDAYFLALALESDSTLVTADEAFLRKARRYPTVISLSRFRLPD